jgi:hypothetical protein
MRYDFLFDRAFVQEQAPYLDDANWTEVFLSANSNLSLNPTRFFLTEWYAWQNPDWHRQHPSPYAHYLDIGRHEGRDPSPYVDMTRYRQAMDQSLSAASAYDLLLQGHHAPWIGVYEGSEDLRRMQDRFYRTLGVTAHRARKLPKPRSSLVVLQSGRGALTRAWFDAGAPRNWDLLVNYYDALGFEPDLGEYVFFQKGTKFTAMWTLWHRYPEVLAPYDHVLFLDDDVETSVVSLNALFDACRTHNLDLAQMSLSEDSSSNWKNLFDRSWKTGPREVSAVEIMMPVFSRRALDLLAPTFGQSISGFGLDLTWGHLMQQLGGRIAVMDGISAVHARPVDQSGGAFYAYLRSHGINAKAELWALLQAYGAGRDVIGVG